MKKSMFILLFFSLKAHAFNLSPINKTIDLGSGKKSFIGRLTNEGFIPVAIQLKALKRSMDINGTEVSTEEFDEIDIYPPQIIIPAQGEKTFKVTYRGKDSLQTEKNFRISAEESPVDFDPIKKEGSRIKIGFRYLSSLYVSPKNATSNVKIKTFSKEDKRLKFIIENSGNKHQVLKGLRLTFLKNEQDTNPLIINVKNKTDAGVLKGFAAENVLAKSDRIFYINDLKIVRDVDASFIVRIEFDRD